MKLLLTLILAAALAGCAGTPAVQPAREAQVAIRQADASNAAAVRSVAAARTNAQRIDDKAVVLLRSKWILVP